MRQQLSVHVEGGGGGASKDGGAVPSRLRQVPFDDWLKFLTALFRVLLVLLLQMNATHTRLANVLAALKGEDEAAAAATAATVALAAAHAPAAGAAVSTADDDAEDGGVGGVAATVASPTPRDALAILDGAAASPLRPKTNGTASVDPSPPVHAAASTSSATSAAAAAAGWSDKEYRHVTRESERVVTDVCDEMHSKVSKLMMSRKQDKVDSGISVEMFVRGAIFERESVCVCVCVW
jgi:hypothetical protein